MKKFAAKRREKFRIAEHDFKRVPSVSLCMTVLLMSLVGCGKLPTWKELTGGGEKLETDIPITKVEPPPKAKTKVPLPLKPVKPVPPPKPKPGEVIARFKSLKSHEIHDNDLQQLSKLESGLDEFVAFDLRGSQVSDAGLASLKRFPRLQKLNVDGLKFTIGGMAAIARVETLTTLSLKGAPHRRVPLKDFDQGLRYLSQMPQLKELNLAGVRLTAAGLSPLQSLIHLERLMLDGTAVTDAGLVHLRGLVNLKQLGLSRTQITDAGFVHLSSLTKLEWLDISSNRIDGSGFKKVGRHGLKYLNASDTNFAFNGLKFIRGSKSLETLGLYKAMVTDLGCKWIAPMHNLRSLSLSSNLAITDVGVSFLKSLKKVEYLGLQDNRLVGDRGVAFLKSCSNLRKLDLHGTACTRRVADYLNEQRRKKNAPPIEVILPQ